jgi:hypothetical protein
MFFLGPPAHWGQTLSVPQQTDSRQTDRPAPALQWPPSSVRLISNSCIHLALYTVSASFTPDSSVVYCAAVQKPVCLDRTLGKTRDQIEINICGPLPVGDVWLMYG